MWRGGCFHHPEGKFSLQTKSGPFTRDVDTSRRQVFHLISITMFNTYIDIMEIEYEYRITWQARLLPATCCTHVCRTMILKPMRTWLPRQFLTCVVHSIKRKLFCGLELILTSRWNKFAWMRISTRNSKNFGARKLHQEPNLWQCTGTSCNRSHLIGMPPVLGHHHHRITSTASFLSPTPLGSWSSTTIKASSQTGGSVGWPG